MQKEKLYHYRLVKKLQIYLKLKKQSVIRCLSDLRSLSPSLWFFSVKWKEAAASLQSKPEFQ